jgi:hypothetical protein
VVTCFLLGDLVCKIFDGVFSFDNRAYRNFKRACFPPFLQFYVPFVSKPYANYENIRVTDLFNGGKIA